MSTDLDYERLIAASTAFAKVADRRNQLGADATPAERGVVEEAISVAFDRFRAELDQVSTEAKQRLDRRRLRQLFIDFKVIGVIAYTVNGSDPKAPVGQWNITNEVRLLARSAA